jgi:hypothetical protein
MIYKVVNEQKNYCLDYLSVNLCPSYHVSILFYCMENFHWLIGGIGVGAPLLALTQAPCH